MEVPSARQIIAARGLLGISQQRLAEGSGVSIAALKRFEAKADQSDDKANTRVGTISKLMVYLNGASFYGKRINSALTMRQALRLPLASQLKLKAQTWPSVTRWTGKRLIDTAEGAHQKLKTFYSVCVNWLFSRQTALTALKIAKSSI